MHDAPRTTTHSPATNLIPESGLGRNLARRNLARRTRGLAVLAAAIVGGTLASCGGGGDAAPVVGGGDTIDTGSSFFFTENHSSGAATSVRLTGLRYGRLVQLFGQDGSGGAVPMGTDFVVPQSLITDADYLLEFNAVTGQENLTILRDVETDQGRAEFINLAEQAGSSLDIIQVQDLTAALFSMMPRNSAIVILFDDLLRRTSIDTRTVQIATGVPPSLPFEGRVFASEYYGGVAPDGSFQTTRVVIDLTISEFDAFSSSVPLVVNTIGLPPSLAVGSANGQLRIPTRTFPAVGITQVLTNLTNHPLATVNNGPVDSVAFTRPVTRAFRTGGRPDVIQDPSNGFLRDEQPPVVVGTTPIRIVTRPVQQGGPQSRRFKLPLLVFESQFCASEPERLDVIVQPGVVAEVLGIEGSFSTGEAENVIVQLVLFPAAWAGPGDWEDFGVGTGTYQAPFDQIADLARPDCFVVISPQSNGFPAAPTQGLSTGSRMSLRFSEPMDPLSLTAFDSLTLTRDELPQGGNLPTSDYIVGRVAQSADLRRVTFVPDQPLAHAEGNSTTENYFLTLANIENSFPPRDLAGNVVETLPRVEMFLFADQAPQLNGGRVSRFTSIDEEPPFGKPEWSGQFLVDPLRELIRPRPIVRSQVVIDQSQAIVRQMTAFPAGVVTPLSNFGSKMQTLWRYADCGFSLTDTQNMNIDIEGINWAPVGGVITPDAFSEFEIRLAHCRYAPDEVIDPQSLFPRFQNSGLRNSFEGNYLQGSPQVTVHPRENGYVIDPAETFPTITGTTLIPFPLNQGVSLEDFTYYTWRDTSIRERSGQSTSGVEPQAYLLALGIVPPAPPYYRANHIQTIGLPLLMEFRTYADENAVGINGWVLSLAVNSSSKPYFRAFTTGGVNQSGTNVFVDPDTQSISNGGFSPGSNPPGATTFGRDNTVHVGALDYVSRISRVHSIWFDTPIENVPDETPRRFNPPTLEPSVAAYPPGTEVDVDFRGAVEFTYDNSGNYLNDNDQDQNGLEDYREDAFSLDLYGDFYNELDGPLNHDLGAVNSGLAFLSAATPDAWRDTADDIENARFYQVRMTFRGNAASGQTAEVSAFAITWNQN